MSAANGVVPFHVPCDRKHSISTSASKYVDTFTCVGKRCLDNKEPIMSDPSYPPRDTPRDSTHGAGRCKWLTSPAIKPHAGVPSAGRVVALGLQSLGVLGLLALQSWQAGTRGSALAGKTDWFPAHTVKIFPLSLYCSPGTTYGNENECHSRPTAGWVRHRWCDVQGDGLIDSHIRSRTPHPTAPRMSCQYLVFEIFPYATPQHVFISLWWNRDPGRQSLPAVPYLTTMCSRDLSFFAYSRQW